jgi:hypothetical protein
MDRPAEALEVDSPEEVSVFVVGVLVGRDNIAAHGKQMAGDPSDDSGTVDA